MKDEEKFKKKKETGNLFSITPIAEILNCSIKLKFNANRKYLVGE